MNKQDIKAKIDEAELILVGIGEEFEVSKKLQEVPDYTKTCEQIAQAGAQWVMPYVNRLFIKKDQALEAQLKRAYAFLEELLQDKNYFIISTSMCGMLGETALRQDRIVEPCGTYAKMQCAKGCRGSVAETDEALLKAVEQCVEKGDFKGLAEGKCSLCGAPMEFNSLYAEHYLEEGYSDNWEIYTKWLQGTVNRKLCMLELGSDLMFGGILRFRFEKIMGLNQKANLIRVHEKLFVVPEEIKERSMAIAENAVDAMAD